MCKRSSYINANEMCKKDLRIPDQRKTYDKLAVVMVCLNPKSKKGDPLTRILAPGIRAKEKIQQWKQNLRYQWKRKQKM